MRWMSLWREHRSNLFFFLLGSCGGGSVMGTVGQAIANDMHGHPTDWKLFSGFILVGAVLLVVGFSLSKKHDPVEVVPQREKQIAALGIPRLSALQGVEPDITFDPKSFFAAAYYSPVTAEIEHNIRVVAQKFSPNDTAEFYTRFIGVGYVSMLHEYTWALIFGSQLHALYELNSLGVMALDDIRHHFDKAAASNPNFNKSFSFDDWCAFLRIRMLVVTHPTKMIEITHNGRDFLRYIAHVGKDVSKQPN